MQEHSAEISNGTLFVAAAAIRRDEDGSIWYVEPPGRHHDVIRLMRKVLGDRPYGRPITFSTEQGFLLNDGSFVNRSKAKLVAINAKQLLGRARVDHVDLYSEDVW